MNKSHAAALFATLIVLSDWVIASEFRPDEGLVAHWPLQSHAKDVTGSQRSINHGVRLAGNAGVFDGRSAWVEVPAAESLRFGTNDFSIAVWVHTDKHLDDVLGDVISHYDPDTRTGFNLTLMNYAGVTSAQSNWRNVLFGIDDGRMDAEWTDRGRPGTNQYIKSLVVFDADLYAAVWEPDVGSFCQSTLLTEQADRGLSEAH